MLPTQSSQMLTGVDVFPSVGSFSYGALLSGTLNTHSVRQKPPTSPTGRFCPRTTTSTSHSTRLNR